LVKFRQPSFLHCSTEVGVPPAVGVPTGVAVTVIPAVAVRVGVPIAGVTVRVGVAIDVMDVGVRVGVAIAAVGLGVVWARPATAIDTARQKPESVLVMVAPCRRRLSGGCRRLKVRSKGQATRGPQKTLVPGGVIQDGCHPAAWNLCGERLSRE